MQYRRKLLKPPYKYTKTTILLAAHKNSNCNSYKYGKKIFRSIEGGWYKETQSQRILCL